jgi:predicted lipoprotein with Yx(FWY)xxD motif
MSPRSLAQMLPLAAIPLVLVACGSSSGGGGTGTGAAAAKAPISSADRAKVGRVVVDAQGFTLYRFTAEAQGRPVCTGACVKTWPPATVGKGSGLPDHVATVDRPDGGGLQLTYDGHPLYRYAGDHASGDANGDGVGGQWYAVKAGGGSASGGATTTTDSKRSYGY